jgi:hypothetical protein
MNDECDFSDGNRGKKSFAFQVIYIGIGRN